MNENLDLTKILDGCPYGTEFYHAGYGRVARFTRIVLESDCPIRFLLDNCLPRYADIAVTKKGAISALYEGECLLFPSKDQRDWSKFERFWDKPKVERFDVNTLQPFDKVLARDYVSGRWSIDFFSYKKDDDCIRGLVYNWYQVIPYNEETKHLLGTTDDCPEYYKWWKK